jgi:preprotein translocase subunit SecE
MEPQSEEAGSRYDTVLLVVSALLLIGGMGSFYALDPQLSKLPRLGIMVAGLAASVALVYRTALGRLVWSYLVGANVERRKVVWPTRQETVQTTLVIAVFVLLASLLFWGLDSALLWGVQKLTGRGA